MSVLTQSEHLFVETDPVYLTVQSMIALDRAGLLDEFKHLTIEQFLSQPVRTEYPHLRPLPGHAPAVRDMREVLSDRELEVVRLVAEGLSNKEISTRLSLSDKTVKNHISHILAKLKLTARTQVAVLAIRGGLCS